MEESNIPNSKEIIQNLIDVAPSKIFLHLFKPEYVPVDSAYVSVSDITNYSNNLFEIININDLLDYLPYNEITNILNIIFDKLKSGGKLIIQSPDLYKLCCSCAFGDIEIDMIKDILYSNKKSINTMSDIKTEIENRQMIILQQKYINVFEYYIEAKKNQ